MDGLAAVDSLASKLEKFRVDAVTAPVPSKLLRGDDDAAVDELQSRPPFVIGLADMAREVLRCLCVCALCITSTANLTVTSGVIFSGKYCFTHSYIHAPSEALHCVTLLPSSSR